jgi:methyl-accepting chemotaxis protein
MIQTISLQTNLLGINAAIEAANSGQAGRGFRVVAEEIQRLSKSATDSVAKIEGVLKEMTNSVDYITTKIVSSNELFQNQAVVLQDIAKSLEKLNKIADQVRELADKL